MVNNKQLKVIVLDFKSNFVLSAESLCSSSSQGEQPSLDTQTCWDLSSAQGGGVTLPMLLQMTALKHFPSAAIALSSHQHFPPEVFLISFKSCQSVLTTNHSPLCFHQSNSAAQPAHGGLDRGQRGRGGSGTQKLLLHPGRTSDPSHLLLHPGRTSDPPHLLLHPGRTFDPPHVLLHPGRTPDPLQRGVAGIKHCFLQSTVRIYIFIFTPH